MNRRKFDLPSRLDGYLATLSQLYATENKRTQQRIIVNSHPRVHEGWSHDNLDGGIDGHALYLTVPEPIYLAILRKKDALQKEIKADLNKINHLQAEFVEEVFIEMEVAADSDWRERSGELIKGIRVILPDAKSRIWSPADRFRVFLSHKAEVKRETAQLKQHLHRLGATCFVAHSDIRPRREWQIEIENALFSMDAFVALMTPRFHESDWTDQEVGVALARGVPVIAVKLGRDPYGFIGKFQALSASWETGAIEIAKLLVDQERMLESYIAAVEECASFDQGNELAAILPAIRGVSSSQAKRLLAAFNSNGQLQGSFGFSGAYPRRHGPGLATHLKRWTGHEYKMPSADHIQQR